MVIHGRSLKPPPEEMERLWFQALRRGVERSDPRALQAFDRTPRQLLYYGDLSNRFLGEECLDIEQRWAVLESLEHADFECWQGPTAYGIEEPPEDILAYWDRSSGFSVELRRRVLTGLKGLLAARSRVLLLAHSLGAVLVNDALSHLDRGFPDLELVTLGSPLTQPHFLEQAPIFEGELAAWTNLSARGDQVCGPPLARARQLDVINPTMREGRPDPHHALGYLSHPQVGRLVAHWLA